MDFIFEEDLFLLKYLGVIGNKKVSPSDFLMPWAIYDPKGKIIYLNPYHLDTPFKLASTIFHEICHVILQKLKIPEVFHKKLDKLDLFFGKKLYRKYLS